MRDRRLTKRFARASGAMVLVSCALAMLAVQPGMEGGLARAAGAEKKIALHLETDTAEIVGGETQRTTCEPVRAPRETAAISYWRPAHQTRILGTLAILHRLLIGAVQASSQGGQGAGILWVEPACVKVLPPEMGDATNRGERREGDLGMPMERVFAIGHQLLAPPRV